METSHVGSDVVFDGIHIPVIFTVVRASGGIVTQGGGVGVAGGRMVDAF
jgi:hypothetical protein